MAKASKRLHILRVLKRGGVPPADLLKVYFGLIRSVLEYCCSVWHNALPVKLSDSIERVQKRTLRYLSSAALPTGLSYYRVCITSHKKNGVV